ncbi:MAG: hypothetical protein Q9M30_08775, partial [Mariprofundaceae bacterium]|nr:hypothetical protein [Mariprofundaceae bacterium]
MKFRKNMLFTTTAMVLALFMAGCNGSSSTSTATTSTANVSGSAGDGPIVGGTVTVTDANGANVSPVGVTPPVLTDANAHYTFPLPSGTALPLTVTISGGTD